MSTCSLTARLVFPVNGPPLPGGVITLDGDRIAAVAPAGTRMADLDLGNAAIIPGLVNAHTHLDLTGMRGLAPPTGDFTGWLRRVIAHRRARSPGQVAGDVRAGLAEAIRTGTTLLGDVSGDGGSWGPLSTSAIRCVIFRELIGLSRERASAAWDDLHTWLASAEPTPTLRPGVSPHAPYSARASLYHLVGLTGLPVMTHLAETTEELRLLATREGPFVGFLTELGAWSPDGLVSGPGRVVELASRAPRLLLAHGNYLAAEVPLPSSATVVYCPRTHAAFGHPPHPFRDFLARGVRVALGTDGLASNPDLDLLAEARFVRRRHPDVPGEALLRMATLSGAEALGWEDEAGSLEAGKSADLAVVPLPEREGECHDLLFGTDSPASRVMCRGEWVVP